jgi:hypothetical protein
MNWAAEQSAVLFILGLEKHSLHLESFQYTEIVLNHCRRLAQLHSS